MRVAIVGVTGAVGQAFLELLEERDFPITSILPYASANSAGKKITFKGAEHTILALPENGRLEADLVFSSASGTVSKNHAKNWVAHGAVVIDNTSAWRMDTETPLVIPEVNPADLAKHQGIIANPNCSTIIALIALAPLEQAFGMTRFTVATYQAVSGAGAAGIDELAEQSRAYLKDEPLTTQIFQHPIAFNLFSHDSAIGEDGYNFEERKMLLESQKILHRPDLKISATCVRVPTFRAHSEAIHVEFKQAVNEQEARAILKTASGVTLIDDRANNNFPTPQLASNKDNVFVGRIRNDSSCTGGIALFVAGDQIRKGAALNSVQIAEEMLAQNLI